MKNSLNNSSKICQTSISAINTLENNLEKLTNSSAFGELSKEEKTKLLNELEAAQTNLHFFSEYFATQHDSKVVFNKPQHSKIMCIQEGDSLIIRVMKRKD